MAIVVDDVDAVPGPGMGEAPLDAAEAAEPGGDSLRGDAEMMGDGDGSRRVLDVVLAGHGDGEVWDLSGCAGVAVANQRGEDRLRAVAPQIDVAHVRLRAGAVGDDATVLDATDQRLHLGVVHAHHREAVERYVLDELPEGCAHPVERAVIV